MKRFTFGAVLVLSLSLASQPAQAQTALSSGVPVNDSVAAGAWDYFYIDATASHTQLFIQMTGTGDADLYVRKNALPTLSLWDFRPYLSSSNETVTVNGSTSPPLSAGRWYIGVNGYTSATYTLTATLSPSTSSQSGMGALPYSGGVGFRVWAPNATSVTVAGEFNGWSATANPLVSEGNGNWSTDVPGALIGDEYKYVITNGSALWKNDAQAKDVTNSVGNSVVYDSAYDWDHLGTATVFTDGFEATSFNAAWTRSGTSNWRVALSTTYKATGARGATLDDSVSGGYSTSRLTLNVNVAGYANLSLTYKIRNVGDESHSTDGVYISEGGASYTKIGGFPGISSSFSTVTLNISQLAAGAGITPGASFKIRFQQYDDYPLASDGIALDDVTLTGNPPAPAYSTPPWNQMVIYEMHVGTFNDTAGGLPGTFTTALARLDHLQSIGVNAVEVMPLCEFAGDFSWGYNPAHPWTVESAYGTPQAYKEFVKQCHARGIAVIQDVVYNHFGPSDLDLWQYDGWSQNGLGGIYFYNDYRSSTPWGDTRPDYGRTEVRTYLRDNALWWLGEYRADGLRWDSTVNIRTVNNGGGGDIPDGWSLMQWVNDEINAIASWKISIAEDLQNNEWLTKTTGSGGAGFDSQWDAQFVHPIRDAVIEGTDANRDMYAVRDAVNHYYNSTANQRVIYTESHDEVANGSSRVPEEIWPGNAASWFSKKRSTLGAAVVFTAPGIPMMFQGQEFLEDGYFADTDAVDWTKLTTFAGIKDMYRDMIRLRRNWFDTTRGLRGNSVNVHHVNNTNKVIGYHRWENGGPKDDAIVVLNFANTGYSSYNLGFPRAGLWKVRFNSDWNGYSADFGNWNSFDTTAVSGVKDGMAYNANVGIGPYTAIILSQDN